MVYSSESIASSNADTTLAGLLRALKLPLIQIGSSSEPPEPHRPAIRRSRPGWLPGIVLAAMLVVLSAAAAMAEGLFTTSSETEISSQTGNIPDFLATHRARDVVLDTAYLTARIAPTGSDHRADRLQRLPEQQVVRIELFPGTVLDLEPRSISEAFGGGYVWVGEAEGGQRGSAHLIIRDGQIRGHVNVMTPYPINYRIDPVAEGGIHRITELDPGAFPPEGHSHDGSHGHGHDHAHGHDLHQEFAISPFEPAPTSDTSIAIIDVLIAYTEQAEQAATSIEAEASLAISMANTGFSRSNIHAQYRLVGLERIEGYTEGSMRDLLTDMRDGFLPPFRSLEDSRNELGADLVATLTTSGEYCGIAYVGHPTSPLADFTVYSVTALGCINNHTFTHELGHNLGMLHDRYVHDPAPASVYHFGFVSLPGQFLTVMAYQDECVANGIWCTRINNFSNPDIMEAGLPTGIPVGTEGAADGARLINERRHGIADFRPEGGNAPTTLEFSWPETGQAGSMISGNVTVTTEDGTPASGYVEIWIDGERQGAIWLLDASGSAAPWTIMSEGTYDIVARFMGSRDFGAAFSPVHTITIGPGPVSTETTLTGPSSASLGESVTFEAQVSAADGTPSGDVRFARNGMHMGSDVALDSNGRATFTTSTLPVGTHQITATFFGSPEFSNSMSQMPIEITGAPPPPNDLFADRITIPGPGTYTGTTVGATSEPGQPTISASNSTNAIWWRYTAPTAGLVNIDLCDSDYDTTLAVFTGSTLSNLSHIVSDDVGCSMTAEVEFQATAGTEYQIGVGGWNNQTGNVVLNLAFEAGPVSTETALSAPASGTVGENLTFSADVSAESGIPAGMVSFRRNGVQFASSALDAQGSASTIFNGTPEGVHEITAHYLGNDDFEPSASASSTLTITLAEIATTTQLDIPGKALVDEPIVLQATVSSADGVPTGSVRFRRDDVWIGTASMNSQGIAILGQGGWLTLPEGMHQIRAEYFGNGSFLTSMSEPQMIVVAGSETQITELAVGGRHACGLTFGGDVYCWGANDTGQLGDGTTDARHRAQQVQGLRHPAVTISAGLEHSCALLENGRSFCWGDNSHGQLGNTDAGAFSTAPVLVQRASNSVDISTPGNSSCLLDISGGMRCWGANSSGQLGTNSTVDQDTPTRVRRLARGGTTLGAGGAGAHNCALNEIGRVFCWGQNADAQVGDGTMINRTIATRVDLPRARNWRMVAIGEQHSCATNRAGRAFCWGRNSSGELGDGTLETRLTPVPVEGLGGNVQALALGAGFSCALNRGRRAFCWGANTDGRLGAGLAPDVIASEPVRVRRLGRDVRQIATGATSACAIDAAGDVYCWGGNDAGQLGRPQGNPSAVPMLVRSLP